MRIAIGRARTRPFTLPSKWSRNWLEWSCPVRQRTGLNVPGGEDETTPLRAAKVFNKTPSTLFDKAANPRKYKNKFTHLFDPFLMAAALVSRNKENGQKKP